MTDSVGTLLSSSFSYFKTKIVPITVGAVVFGVLMYATQMYFQGPAMSSMSNGMPYGDMERLEELAERAQNGDQAAMQELMAEAENMEGMMGDEAVEAMAMNAMKGVMPALGMFFVFSMLISLVSSAYYLLLALDPAASGKSALAAIPKYILPLLGLWFWVFIRSFAWIPIIGFIFALVLGPRFVAAPVLLIRQNMGVLKSAQKSWEATRGYWGKIFGNLIIVGLIMVAITMVSAFVLGALGQPASFVLVIPMILGSFFAAYSIIFMVRLAETILAHSKTA